jgi:5'-nucleotidase
VNKLVIASAALSLTLAGVGCAKKADNAATNGSALDISAPPPASVAYEPPAPSPTPAAQPVVYDTAPVMATTPAPAAAPSANGGSYTVQRGDTLYGIARQRYGDGKQWQRIAQANPGVTPQSLKVGQTLVIP